MKYEWNDFKKINKHRIGKFKEWFLMDLREANLQNEYRKARRQLNFVKQEEHYNTIIDIMIKNVDSNTPNFAYIMAQNINKYGMIFVREWIFAYFFYKPYIRERKIYKNI